MFAGCISLTSLPNISRLTTPFTRTYYMLDNCLNIIDIPDNYNLMLDVRFDIFQ